MTKQRFKTLEEVAEVFGAFNPHHIDPSNECKVCYLVDKSKEWSNIRDPRNPNLLKYFSPEMIIEEANRIAMGIPDCGALDERKLLRQYAPDSEVLRALEQEKDEDFIKRIHEQNHPA
jgi:hypothetical protein